MARKSLPKLPDDDEDEAALKARLAKKRGGLIAGGGKKPNLGRARRADGGGTIGDLVIQPGPPGSMFAAPPPGTQAVPKDAATRGYLDDSGRPTAAMDALRGQFSQAQGQQSPVRAWQPTPGMPSQGGQAAPGMPDQGQASPGTGISPLAALKTGGAARRKRR